MVGFPPSAALGERSCESREEFAAFCYSGFIPAAQADIPTEGTGPLYTVEALRTFELFGIHLGMKREEARKALAAAAGLQGAPRTWPTRPPSLL